MVCLNYYRPLRNILSPACCLLVVLGNKKKVITPIGKKRGYAAGTSS